MTAYTQLSAEALQKKYDECKKKYDQYVAKGLKLDMSRGKPGADQLALSNALQNTLSPDDYIAEDGTDCRNYGGVDGIPEMKKIFADLMDVRLDEVFVGGNASLTLMYESVISFCLKDKGKRKFLCPSPGYDRHFAITEYLGVDMIPIPMTPDGPDMDAVRQHVTNPAVAGIWCVPVFSNPQGVVYSDEIIKEMAALKPAAEDFRIFWDNAYIAHAFDGKPPKTANILRECEKQKAYDMPFVFTSFSKISFSGAGVCAMAASPANLAKMRNHMIVQIIGPDKLNQLRHVRFFKDIEGIYSHMEKHAEILRHKFAVVLDALDAELKGKDIGSWLSPKGGYFVSFETLPGCAKRTVALCAEAGLVMTPAGATYPYGHDPQDSDIRIAPTFPSLEQLEQAMALFCVAVELAAVEKLLDPTVPYLQSNL